MITKWQASRFTRKMRSIWEASKLTSNKVTQLLSDLLMVYQSESSTSNQAITSLEWLLSAQATLTEDPESSDSRSGVAHSAPNTSSKLPLTVMTSRWSKSGRLSMSSYKLLHRTYQPRESDHLPLVDGVQLTPISLDSRSRTPQEKNQALWVQKGTLGNP